MFHEFQKQRIFLELKNFIKPLNFILKSAPLFTFIIIMLLSYLRVFNVFLKNKSIKFLFTVRPIDAALKCELS